MPPSTTTESLFYPGSQLLFVPVFQPGLSIRDKCECLFCPGSYSTGTNAFFHKQKKIGSLAPAYAFASQFSKSKNLSKTAISKSRSKRSQNQDLKFITHQASVLHTTHNTQVICLSHTQENTRSKIIDSHHKDSQTKKINNRACVRRRPCPRRPTAAGVPDPCAWPRAAVAARQAPARAGLGGCCWSALGGLRLATHGGPPACTRPRRPRRPAAAAARRPACAAACARAAAGRPPPAPVRRLARPCPRRGGREGCIEGS